MHKAFDALLIPRLLPQPGQRLHGVGDAGIDGLAIQALSTLRISPLLPELADRRPLTGHTGTVWSVAFSPDGIRLASGGNDGTVRIWNVGLPYDPHDLLRAVCDIAVRPFTAEEWPRYIPGEPYRPSCPTIR